jgi:hypothetical protein
MRVFQLCTVVASLTVLTGCGDTGTTPMPDATPSGGKLTLVLSPVRPTAPNLTLSQAGVKIEGLAVIGDTTPDYRTMLSGEPNLDMLGPQVTHDFTEAPQGLYSRVRFKLEDITFQGTYNGMPIQGHIEQETIIDLRDPVGQDVWPNHSAVFTVTFDGTQWFGNLLAQAVPSNGQIQIDYLNNAAIGQSIAHNIAAAISLSTAQGPN